MEQAARFEKYDGRAKAWKPASRPKMSPSSSWRAPALAIPIVRGVLAAPSLRPDGSILEAAGYDAATGMYLIDPPPMPESRSGRPRAKASRRSRCSTTC